MLYNVQPKGYSCTQDEHTFFVHLDLRVTFSFQSTLNEDQSKELQQSTFEQVRQSLDSQSSRTDQLLTSGGRHQIPILPLSQGGNGVANRTEPVAPKTVAHLETINYNRDAVSDVVLTATKPRSGATTKAGYENDHELAQSLCSALFQAAIRIKTTELPSWWSDIETLRPKGSSLHDTDAALCVEELDQSCERYSTSLIYRASMTWLIRCFLEIIRRAFHRRSRANAKKHAEDKANREQRYRVGELLVAVTKRLYGRYGKKAYTLCALLAAVKDFNPKAGHWRKFSKARMLRLASAISAILLTPEYEEIWQNIDPALAFDPAEFFTTSSSAKTSFDLSYDRARRILGLTDEPCHSHEDVTGPDCTTPATQTVAPAWNVPCIEAEQAAMPASSSQWAYTWANPTISLPPCSGIGGEAEGNANSDTSPACQAGGLETIPSLHTESWNTLCGEVELSAMPSLDPLWPYEGGTTSTSNDNWSALCGELEISTMRDIHIP